MKTRIRKEKATHLKKCQCWAEEFLQQSYILLTQKFKNIEHNNRQPIYELLIELYEDSNEADIYSLLRNRRINPVLSSNY